MKTNAACLRLVLWDQLTPCISSLKNASKKDDLIVFLETIHEATSVKHHVKKLAFLFSAMRHFSEELKQAGFSVQYICIDKEEPSLTSGMQGMLQKFKTNKIVVTEPGEYRILKELKTWEKKFKTTVEILKDDRFFISCKDFADWAHERKKLLMEHFYQKMRKETGLLMSKNSKPLGGQWNFDKENRQPLHQIIDFPRPLEFKPDTITKKVLKEVKARFSKHFGDLEPFWFAVTRKNAEKVFAHFLADSLPHFGPYQDAMQREEAFLYHSVISHYLNAGLLDPKKICTAVHDAYLKNKIPIESAEGYLRQILGWREFVRGIYWLKMPTYSQMNFFNAKRKLPWFYWTGETPMQCLKEVIGQTRKNAYSHHIQRLMITGNFALLIGTLPQEICEWYLAVYADAHEWVELPNTLGMSQFADGGYLATKPYASSGSYINKMSNFCKNCHYNVKLKEGKSACPFNYLYWNFLMRNQSKLKKNQRLAMAYRTLQTFTPSKKKKIKRDADTFLESLK